MSRHRPPRNGRRQHARRAPLQRVAGSGGPSLEDMLRLEEVCHRLPECPVCGCEVLLTIWIEDDGPEPENSFCWRCGLHRVEWIGFAPLVLD